MKVYISGAIAGLTPDESKAQFGPAGALLTALGHDPVNPMDIPARPFCRCPGAIGDAGTGSGHAWSCYLRKDLAAMLDCDAIYMLPGWESSHGARLELQVASAVGLRVLWATAPADLGGGDGVTAIPDGVYRACTEAAWEQPGTQRLWRPEQRETYIGLMLARPDWRALVDAAFRAGQAAILRQVADECDTIRRYDELGEFMPSAETWMRHRADQIEAGGTP